MGQAVPGNMWCVQAVTSETDQREPRADGQDTNHACLSDSRKDA